MQSSTQQKIDKNCPVSKFMFEIMISKLFYHIHYCVVVALFACLFVFCLVFLLLFCFVLFCFVLFCTDSKIIWQLHRC